MSTALPLRPPFDAGHVSDNAHAVRLHGAQQTRCPASLAHLGIGRLSDSDHGALHLDGHDIHQQLSVPAGWSGWSNRIAPGAGAGDDLESAPHYALAIPFDRGNSRVDRDDGGGVIGRKSPLLRCSQRSAHPSGYLRILYSPMVYQITSSSVLPFVPKKLTRGSALLRVIVTTLHASWRSSMWLDVAGTQWLVVLGDLHNLVVRSHPFAVCLAQDTSTSLEGIFYCTDRFCSNFLFTGFQTTSSPYLSIRTPPSRPSPAFAEPHP